MASFFYPQFQAVYIDADGVRVPVPNENFDVANITQANVLDPVASDAEGVVVEGSYPDSDPIALDDIIEFSHATYPNTIRFTVKATQAEAYTAIENDGTAYIVQNDQAGTTNVNYTELFIIDNDSPTRGAVYLGRAQVGVENRYNYPVIAAKDLDIRSIVQDEQGQFGETDITKAESANLVIPAPGAALYQPLDAELTSLAGLGIAQGDLIYGSAADTYSKLAKNTTATRYLSNTGSSNNPAWAQVALTTGVSGILPIANGGTNASSFGTTNGVGYFDGTRLVNDADFTFTGTDLTVSGAGNTYIQNAGLYIGGNGITTGMSFRGGSTGSGTYTDFKYIAGGGSREMSLLNQLSSRYVLFITGGSDADNATNSFVGMGSTGPVGKLHVQQSNAAYSVIVAEGASGQTGRLLSFMPFGAGSYLSAFDSAGSLAIGHGSPSAALDIIKTTEQARFGYDASNYLKFTVGSSGITTIDGLGASKAVKFASGLNLGFFGATAVAQSTGWAVTNHSTDKVLDASATTLGEVINLLCTLITDLKTYGVLGA